MHGNQHDQVIRNCGSKWSRQYPPGTTTARAWQKIGPAHVVHLLETAAAPARADANSLLQQLARQPWRIGATVRTDDARGVDPGPHVTVVVGARSYHLGCKEKPDLHVVSVTA